MKSLRQLRRISVTTTPEAEDAVTELLSAILNLPASTYYDIESGVSTVTVYLQRKSHLSHKILAAISAGLKRIRSCGLKIGSGKIVMARVRRENWAESWKRHFKPIEIRFQNRRDLLCEPPSSRNKSGTRVTCPSEELGKSLLIKPSWSTRKTRKDQVIVVLDPGLSFGTGHHPTTAFCLNEIVRLQKNQDSVLRRLIAAVETVSKPDNNLLAPRGTSGERNEEWGIPSKNAPPRPDPLLHCMEEREKAALSRSPETRSANRPCLKSSSLSFLDLGTGSGILAIAGVKLGYSPVSAMDFDPEAVRVARANARVNHVGQKLKIRRGDVTKLPLRPRRQYDLVCANLISNLLITERRRIVAQLNRTGTLVLAGILKPEFKEVQKAYKTLGLRPISRRDEKEWCSGSFCFGR